MKSFLFPKSDRFQAHLISQGETRMRDVNVNREELLIELESLRRKVAELEAETSFLRKQRPAAVDSSNERISDETTEIIEDRRIEEARRETSVALEALIKGSPSAVIAFDPDGNVTSWNPAAARMFGWSESEVTQKPLQDASDGVVIELRKLRERIFRGGTLSGLESRRQDQDCLPSDSSISEGPIQNAKVQIKGIIGLDIHVPEKKNAQENIRFAQFTIDNCADAVFWVRSDGSPIYVNDAACRSLGYPREELLNLSVQDINTSFPTKQWEEHWKETKQKRSCTIQAQHKRKDGSVFPVELRMNFVEFEGHEYHCTFAIDISERKQAEQALQESMEKFRSIVENAYAGIFTVDEAYRLVYVNDQFSALTGYPRDYLLGSDFRHLLTAESRSLAVERYIRRQRRENVPNRYELDVVRLDREVRRMEMTAALVKDASGIPRIMGQLIDITERKQTEEAIRKSERRLSEALQVARMGCWEYDVNQDVFILNDQYYSLHGTTASREGGYRISAGEFLRKYVHPEDAVLLRSAIQRATEATDPDYQFQAEGRILTADAEIRWANLWFRIEQDARGKPSRCSVSFRILPSESMRMRPFV